MFSLTRVVLLFVVLCAAQPAAAQGVSMVTICFRWQSDFTDADQRSDFLTDNEPLPAYGVWAEITLGGSLVFYRGYTRSSDGCLGAALPTLLHYEIRMRSQARVADGQVVHYQAPNGAYWELRVDSDYSPAPGIDSVTYTWGPGLGPEVSSVMTAATHTVRTARGYGAPDGNWRIVASQCGTDRACYKPTGGKTGKIYIGGASTQRKFEISHEMGHHVQNLYGSKIPDVDTSLEHGPYTLCSSFGYAHVIGSLEFQSAAANEGFAHFVAAVAWNRESERDCTYDAYSCEGRSGTGWSSVSGTRYAENRCMNYDRHIDGPPIPMPGTGNAMDWTRTFWDLVTDRGVPYRDVYELMGSLRGSHRHLTYYYARDAAERMGMTEFEAIARRNGIDW